jgi:primosomal protein N' (replication factor Y)
MFDATLLELARWVSARYVAPLASVLARLTPPRVVSEEEGWARQEREPGSVERAPGAMGSVWDGYREGATIADGLDRGRGTFIVRPAPDEEAAVLLDAVSRTVAAGRRAIVLVPEAEPVPFTAAAILAAVGERATLFAGGSKRARYRRWLEIAAGRYDVVVGTRPAVFAPMRDVGVIALARESHPGHREDRSPYYHVRDVALARARIESAACVVSALAPSVETTVIEAVRVEPSRRRWPPVEIVRPGPEGRAPRVISALRTARRAFLYSPLPGYGIAQVCRSCHAPAACAACGGILRA